jgi:hypothetical protein
VKVPYMDRVVAESKERIKKANALAITTEQLERGIHRLGLGEDDDNRINAVSTTFEVNVGSLELSADKTKGLDKPHMYPSHIIDTTVLVAMNTEQCAKAVNLALSAFSEIRNEVNNRYIYAAEYVLKVASENHAMGAYAGYVKILSVSKNIDKITVKRGDAISAWVYTLRDEVEKAKALADFIERAHLEAFLAKMANRKFIRKNDTKDRAEDDDSEVI